MANNFEKYSDNDLVTKAQGIVSTIIENPADYGLNGEEVEALDALVSSLDSQIGIAQDALQNKISAFQTKAARRAEVLTQLGSIVKRIYSDLSVNNDLLTKAGLSPRAGKPQYLTPNIPLDLSASVAGPRSVELRWKRNGNTSPTQYIIERLTAGNTWEQLAAVTASKFVHSNVTPGTEIIYRVYAQRGNRRSDFSNEAVIWGNAEGPTLSIAA